MFQKIENVLKELESCPNIYISQNKEFVRESINDSDVKDYVKKLQFTIVKRGITYQNVIYRTILKENNPESYLEKILNDLIKIRDYYIENRKPILL